MLRGELWLAVWPNDPLKKERPVLIVSNNLRNSAPNLADILVVKLTGLYRDDSSRKPTNATEDVVVKFKKDTIIRCAAIFALEKSSLVRRLSQISIATMHDVDVRLKNVLDLN